MDACAQKEQASIDDPGPRLDSGAASAEDWCFLGLAPSFNYLQPHTKALAKLIRAV